MLAVTVPTVSGFGEVQLSPRGETAGAPGDAVNRYQGTMNGELTGD